MALITADRVREFTSTNGTGAFTLTGAAVGYQTFASAIGSGNTCYYAAYNPGVNEWEVGLGTVGTGTLARTTVLSSSNSDNLVDFSAGTKDVFVTYPAETAIFNGGSPTFGAVTASTVSSGQVNITGQGDLRLQDTTGGEYVALQAPGTLAASYTLTMPADDGTPGQALITDGSGNLSWSTSASGDVYGPASATDNAVTRFDGTTGKLIQNSGVVIDDSNNVTGVVNLTSSGSVTLSGGTANGVAYLNGSKVLTTGSGLVFDGSNLGLGVTPSAWNAAFKVVQVSKAAISGLTNSGFFSSNAYYGASGWNYITSDYALYYGQENGSHKWFTAPSGTAGNAISFTQAMTLDASGNLLIGTTANSPSGKLNIAGNITPQSASTYTLGTQSYPWATVYANTISATSLVVGGDITWTQSTDSYSRTSGVPATTPVVTDVHTSMRRCVLRDDLTVNYYLDPTNSALKAAGTASDLTGADGQVMVEIPAFYVKFTPGANRNYAVSLLPAPGYTLHPAFMKDGVFTPYRYYGAYDACVFNGSVYESGLNYDNNWTAGQNWSADGAAAKLASVSGVYPAVGATRANFRTMAANRGTGWREVDFYLESAVQLLYLVEYGSFNSQAKLGNGNVSVSTGYPASSGNQTDSPHSVAGKSNSIGNASTNTTNGASSSTRDTAFMSYRGIENWYGNCWNWVDGFNINNNQAYVSNVHANFADDTATNYDALGAPMVASNGWVTNVQQLLFGFLPSAVGGGSTTYLADYYYQAAGWRVAGFGGDAVNGASAGAFYWALLSDSGVLSRSVGGRLAA